jgi:hypothetical protein
VLPDTLAAARSALALDAVRLSNIMVLSLLIALRQRFTMIIE